MCAGHFSPNSSTDVSTLNLPEQELLDRVRSGDRDAFELLFRTHYPSLLRFAHAQLRGDVDAEDVVHDVFLRLWSERTRLGPVRSLRSYLLTSVRHRVIDLIRHRKVEQRLIVGSTDERPGANNGLSVADIQSTHSESDAAALAELDEAIRRGVAALPERCRMAFLLCREQGLSYAEAAEVMGVSPATVKTQMARALASLRTAVDPYLAVLLAVSPFLR